MDAEDFLPVRETYPEHPDHKIKPNASTKVELDRLRKESYIASINDQKQRWERENPASIEMKFVESEFLV